MTDARERTLVELVGAYRGRLELVGEHARRLAASARATGLDRNADARKLELQFAAAWQQAGRGEGFVFARWSRGGGQVVIVVARSGSELPEGSEIGVRDPELLAKGLALATSVCAADDEPETLKTQDAPDSIVGLRPKWIDESAEANRASAAARAELARRGVDERLLARPGGEVVGAPRANVFFQIDEELVTPSLESGAFPGILRATVIHAAADLGVPIVERAVTAADVARAKDAFLTRSIDRIVSVRAIDGRELTPPPTGSRWRRFVPQLRLRVHELCRAPFLPES